MVDIDGTICTATEGDYHSAQPYVLRIDRMNKLFDDGHEIHYYTARGSKSDLDWSELTKRQLESWNVKYTSLRLGKPQYDIWIDDKAFNSEVYFS